MERQGYKGIYFLHEPMNKEKLKCSIYQKPIDKNNLIPAASFHASAMKKGLPFIQILRVKIICSNSDENKQKINEVILTYFESEAWKEGRQYNSGKGDDDSNGWICMVDEKNIHTYITL